jgi:hypothetical protein
MLQHHQTLCNLIFLLAITNKEREKEKNFLSRILFLFLSFVFFGILPSAAFSMYLHHLDEFGGVLQVMLMGG